MTNKLEKIALKNKIKHALNHYKNTEYHIAIEMLEEVLSDPLVDKNGSWDAKAILSYCYLSIGELVKGWRYWKYRKPAQAIGQVVNKICNLQEWDGTKLGEDENLFLMAEDGVGDELYYSAVFHLLTEAEYAAKIYITCDERIKSLYERTYPEFTFIGKDDWPEIRKQARNCSVYGLIGDLPRYLDPTLKSPRYKKLRVDEQKFQEISKLLKVFGENTIFIGVSYKSSGAKMEVKNLEKILWEHMQQTIKIYKMLAPNNAVVFINLQENNLTADDSRGFLYDNSEVKQLDDLDLWNDFEVIGALIENMTLVFTVENYIAHLSGSLQKVTDLFLPKFCNARWCYGDPDRNKWYHLTEIYQEE